MEYLDMLAKLGISGAHPGGFAATLQQFDRYPLPPNSRILEVGCGTGRTACYAAARGHEVTGIDLRPDMVAKAKKRAEQEGVTVNFQEGDACMLPFAEDTFDVVLVESVSIFTNTPKALAEYRRVLRGGGTLFDREVVRRHPLPPRTNREISEFYQVAKLWSVQDWNRLIKDTGFDRTQIDGPYPFPKINEDLLNHPDPFQLIDDDSLFDETLWEVIRKYNRIMERYSDDIGFILMIGMK